MTPTCSQDLHIHTVFSTGDSAIVKQQTIDLIAFVRHAQIIGISDHFEYIDGDLFDIYRKTVLARGLKLGTEVAGGEYAKEAAAYPFEYYIYHCPDERKHYRGFEKLLETGKPAVIAHPMAMGTDFRKLPEDCLVEINNRYIWRGDWRKEYTPFLQKFRFILSSDAHQPNWLNQNVARYVAAELGVTETLLFT